MFTIKFYRDGRQIIRSAHGFTILRDANGAEITMHQLNHDSERLDVGFKNVPRQECFPERFDRAIIENAAGKTTEIISFATGPNDRQA